MKVHQIKIDFNVTEQIKWFVYVYNNLARKPHPTQSVVG